MTTLKEASEAIAHARQRLIEAAGDHEGPFHGLHDIDVAIAEQYTEDGKDRPVTAVFDFADGAGMSAERVVSLLTPLLANLGIQQVVVERMHWDDRETVTQ